jgi:hypothetical protein
VALPWTKFQDFYLRLGLLKVLVAVLSPQRRSVANDAIYRRLRAPLTDAAKKHAALWQQVEHSVPWHAEQHAQDHFDKPSVTEALLVADDCPSWLFALTAPTVYKVLDWGHDVGLVGRGNQISERGLMLRLLLPAGATERFLAGDPLAWNPFRLTEAERLFFLYHLGEIDRLTQELISDLAHEDPDRVLESADAGKLTCRALFRVLDRAQADLSPHDLPAFRVAKELACVIAQELELSDLLNQCGGAVVRRLPKPLKVRRRSAMSAPTKARRTTKNADHQTVPRFEQLVDLGVLDKPVTPSAAEGKEGVTADPPQRRWRYRPTPFCRNWERARTESRASKHPWEWNGFAQVAVRALYPDQLRSGQRVTEDTVVRYLWDAYEAVRRPAGHTPADSVMLLAMIRAAIDGHVIEMARFHELLLAIKQGSLLPDHAFFSSGNDLDKMFILLRPGFREKVREVSTRLYDAPERA